MARTPRLQQPHRPVQIPASQCIRAQRICAVLADRLDPPTASAVIRAALEIGLEVIERDPTAHGLSGPVPNVSVLPLTRAALERTVEPSPRPRPMSPRVAAQVAEANRVWREQQEDAPEPEPPALLPGMPPVPVEDPGGYCQRCGRPGYVCTVCPPVSMCELCGLEPEAKPGQSCTKCQQAARWER